MQRRTFLSLALPAHLPATALAAQKAAVLRRAWLGASTRRHGHDALGTGSYPGALHATIDVDGREVAVQLDLPVDAGFEDGVVRRVNLDGGATDQVVLVRSTRRDGAAIAVYGIEGSLPILRELAKG